MRILGLSQRLYLGDIHLALTREGHDVRVFASDPPALRAFGGLLDPIEDWRAGLEWVGRDGVVLVEGVRQGAAQDALRRDGYRVVGGSAYGDRLENDRDFGQATLRDAGLPIAQSRAFDTPEAALRWLDAHPGRYVLKHDDGAHPTFVGEHAEGADLAFQLRRAASGRVLLMPRLDGVEVGVGAYFDGQAFLRPACIDFEHKRFFPGELGEMTGEMGTLASFEHAEPLFAHTLDRMAPAFRAAGHVGYVNLNLIVNEQGAWPLEFTCRIGNPGFAVLAALQPAGWGDLLARMAGLPASVAAPPAGPAAFPTRPGWSVAIVLTVPPFPGVASATAPEDDPPVFFHRDPRIDSEEPQDPSPTFGEPFVMRPDEAAELMARKVTSAATFRTWYKLTAGPLSWTDWRRVPQRDLATDLGLRQASISRAMSELLDLGFIERRGGGPIIEWRLTMKGAWPGSMALFEAAQAGASEAELTEMVKAEAKLAKMLKKKAEIAEMIEAIEHEYPTSEAEILANEPDMRTLSHLFPSDFGSLELAYHHFVDMRRDGEGQLRVHRRSGHAMIVTGTGATVAAAQEAARARARNVVIPELRWRGDIGDRFAAGEGARLAALGWLPPECAATAEHEA